MKVESIITRPSYGRLVVLGIVVSFSLSSCTKQNSETPPSQVMQTAAQRLVGQNEATPPPNGNAASSAIAVEHLTQQPAAPVLDACTLPVNAVSTGVQMGGALQCVPPENVPTVPTKHTDSFATFAQPAAITTDGRNLYVVDNDRIRKVAIATGVVTTLTKLRSAADHSVMSTAHGFPGITTDGTNLYLADQEHNEVRKVIIATGELTTLTGFGQQVCPPFGYCALQGITFDGKNVYALGVSSIFKIDPVSRKVTQLKRDDGPGIKPMPINITTDGRYLYLLNQAEVVAGQTTGPEIRKIEIDTGRAVTVANLGIYIGWGAHLTTDGNYLYITVPERHCIYQVEIATGKMNMLAGSENSYGSADGIGLEATFLSPTGITSDGRNLYVSDSQDARIRKIAISNRLVTTQAGSVPGKSLDGVGLTGYDLAAEGLATDGKYLFVADPSNSSIRRIDLATNTVSTLVRGILVADGQRESGAMEPFLNLPRGLIAEAGNLYVADYNNHVIRKVEIATGEVTTLAGSNVKGNQDGTGPGASFNYPYGIASDGTNLYISDYNNHKIRQVKIATGKVTTLAGSGKEGSKDGVGKAASFAYPRGLVFEAGMLYVADYANNVIRQVEISTGKVRLLAGSGQPGFIDGIGQNAMFRQPSDIAADGDKLYVADTYNNCIRQIEIATGKVTTLAGSGKEGNVDGIGVAASFDRPLALAIGGGKLYVADSTYHLIRSIDLASGAVETLSLTGTP